MNKKFTENVQNTWGKAGEEWLLALPQIIAALSSYWRLSEIQPVNNMSYNYVAIAKQDNKSPYILKISCDEKLITQEAQCLQHFQGSGAIALLDTHAQYKALLLQQAIPGVSLKELFSKDIHKAIVAYSQVVKALSKAQKSQFYFDTVESWCEVFNKISTNHIPEHYVEKAKELKKFLFKNPQEVYVCHGDLHLDNILSQHDSWLAIDPKGVIGEMAFEAAAFDLVTEDELHNQPNVKEVMIQRIHALAQSLNIDYHRLLSWNYLRLILSAQWFVEDKGIPEMALKRANYIYMLLEE